MKLSSLVIPMGLGVAVGAVAIMMTPRKSNIRKFANKAADKMEDAAEKIEDRVECAVSEVSDKVSEQMGM